MVDIYDLHLSKLWVNIIMASKKLLLTGKKCLLFENCYWTQQEGSPQKGYEKFSHHFAFTKTSVQMTILDLMWVWIFLKRLYYDKMNINLICFQVFHNVSLCISICLYMQNLNTIYLFIISQDTWLRMFMYSLFKLKLGETPRCQP